MIYLVFNYNLGIKYLIINLEKYILTIKHKLDENFVDFLIKSYILIHVKIYI